VTEAPRRVLPVAGRPAARVEVGSGSGPLLVLVHGAGGSADLWQPQLDGLADVARIVAPDLPGHGPLGGRGGVSIAAYAEWLAGFVSALDAGPVVLVGHSMGGAIAQTLALAQPERLAGLVLLGTAARLPVLPRLVELLRQRPGEGLRLIRDLSEQPAPVNAAIRRFVAELRDASIGTVPVRLED
jgi:pimeloyl-ACP methyl ester carboxylesterase